MKRTFRWHGGILVLPGILWSPAIVGGAEPEVAGMITEIHPGRGQVEVRSRTEALARRDAAPDPRPVTR